MKIPITCDCQLAHCGTIVLHMDASTHQTAMVSLRMEKCNGTLTWSLQNTSSEHKTQHISAGLRLKYMTRCKENITYLDEGFIDMVSLKTVEMDPVDMLTVPKQTLADISSCFQVMSFLATILPQLKTFNLREIKPS